MNKKRHINLARSAIATGFILSVYFYFFRSDLALTILGFLLLQVTMILTNTCLILMRIASWLKNKNAGFYYFSATMQAGLCIADIILLFNAGVIKSSLMIFLGLNALMATIIFYDIYITPDGKGNLAGDPGSETAVE